MSQLLDVVVVGGGLGGLTAALALRQRGMTVTVLEQAPELGEVGAGIQTAPNASRILLSLGLRHRLEAIRTEPLDQVRRRWSDGAVIGMTALGERCQREYGAPYWHYHRADLHRELLLACTSADQPGPPVSIHTAAQVVALDQSGRPVVTLGDGQCVEADVVIGADGIRSSMRDLAGFADTLEFSGEMAFRALIPGDLIRKDPATRWLVDRFQSTIWYGPDRHLVHYLIRGGEMLNVVAIVPSTPEVRDAWTCRVSVQDMVGEFAEWDDRVAAMLSKAEDDVTAWAMYYRRPDPVWVDGRVALLGDACHAMVPYQAQGASQAMEDAAVLAEELAMVTVDGVPTALRRYAARRARHAGIVQQASLHNMDLYHLPDGPAQQERDRKLDHFDGESYVSYNWLWSGTPLNPDDREPFDYQFAR